MSLEEIYIKYGQRFAKFVYKNISDKSMAEDIVQDVFVTLCRNKYIELINNMEEEEVIKYIYRCLDHRIIDLRRKDKRLEIVLEENKNTCSKSFHEPEVVSIRNAEIKSAFEMAVDAVGEEDFFLLIDIYYDNVPRSVIAEKLGINIGTLNTRISRLKKSIKKKAENIERREIELL